MCRIQEPDNSETAAAPWPQIQPVARLRTYFQQSHEHTQQVRCAYTQVRVPAPQNGTAEALSTRIGTKTTSSLILLPSLGDQGEGLLVQNVCT